ncbi:DUF6612 family protein [Peribacillus loiseleuriae]|uniref:DUF6612 family protein n=1 Tax=Peribacillus loiseleuriae TaxID=1679170 RepID=UPI003805B69E
MKRVVVWTLLVACIFMLISPFQASAASQKVKVVVNGEVLKLDAAPYMKDNRVLVPIRGVFEKLGLKVNWNQSAKTATIKSDDTAIIMTLGKKEVQVNGKTTKIDTAVSIKENRLFIPVRFVIENSGANVKWSQADQTVHITTNSAKEAAIKAFLSKVAQTKINSLSTNMKIKQSMNFSGEKINADMNLDMDMVLDPLGIYQVMSMAIDELGDEKITTKSYLTKDGFYVHDSANDQWVKYDDQMVNELLKLSDYQMNPNAQFEIMQRYYKDVKVIEKNNTYELHTSLSGDGFQELLAEILNLSGLGIGEDLFAGIEMSIKKMEMVTILDKKNLYPLSGSMESDMTMTVDGEKMNIVQEVEYSYSNINKLKAITIPQEVIDKAVPFKEMYPELE